MKKSGIFVFVTLLVVLLGISCSGPESEQPLLTAELPLHLEDHIDKARIEGSKVHEDFAAPVVWDFSEPQPDWRPIEPVSGQREGVRPIRTENGLRLPLQERIVYPEISACLEASTSSCLTGISRIGPTSKFALALKTRCVLSVWRSTTQKRSRRWPKGFSIASVIMHPLSPTAQSLHTSFLWVIHV